MNAAEALEHVLGLPAFRGMATPELHLRPWTKRMPWGEADRDEYAVYLYGVDGNNLTDAEVLTLVHELAHLHSERTWHHHAPFRRLVAQAALELWGVDCRHLVPRSVDRLETGILRRRWWRTSLFGRFASFWTGRV